MAPRKMYLKFLFVLMIVAFVSMMFVLSGCSGSSGGGGTSGKDNTTDTGDNTTDTGDNTSDSDVSATTGKIPDTGQITDYTDTYGEDSNYSINTQSYTKLSASGKALPSNATDWAMVKDNVTGLIWEVKSAKTYSEYADEDINNALHCNSLYHRLSSVEFWSCIGDIHNYNAVMTWEEANDVFISQLNSDKFGGYSDWRLPTIKEMAMLISEDSGHLDETYFPIYPSESTVSLSFWWTSTSAPSDSDYKWQVPVDSSLLSTGSVLTDTGIGYAIACAVHGQTTQNNFVDNGDGTVTDSTTGLMWQKETAEDNGSGLFTWDEALTYCEGLNLAGHVDWRLPNRNELQSLVDYSRENPAIDTVFFPDTEINDNGIFPCGSDRCFSPGYYWSSTSNWDEDTLNGNLGEAWIVGFYMGIINIDQKENSQYVRAVRNVN